jgi:hypothetical protein
VTLTINTLRLRFASYCCGIDRAKLQFGCDAASRGRKASFRHSRFARTYFTRALTDQVGMVLRRLAGQAKRLSRFLMKSDPTDASAPFNLGNMLRADGRNVEAETALRAATRVDPTLVAFGRCKSTPRYRCLDCGQSRCGQCSNIHPGD